MGNFLDLRELSNITYGFLNGITYESVFPCSQEDFVPGAFLSNVFITRDDGTRISEFDVWYEKNKTLYDNLQLPPGDGKKQVRYLPRTIGGIIQYNGCTTHWIPTVVFSYNYLDRNYYTKEYDAYLKKVIGCVVLENNKWYDLAINYEFEESPFDLIDSYEHVKNRAFVDYIIKLFL